MRKWGFIITLGLCITIAGCGVQPTEAKNLKKQTQKLTIKSEVSQAECCICGDNERSLMPYYRKMDSVGIVCLNTMNISNTDVRIYDDDGTELLQNDSMIQTITSHGEDECSFWISGMPNRGITEVRVDYGKLSKPDWKRIKTFLCQNCLNKVLDMYQEEMEWNEEEARFPEVCLVDFTDNELYSLGKAYGGYSIRDYYVRIEHGEQSDEILIFYAPERCQ